MAKLIYGAITSLDGYVNDAEGAIEWGRPDDETAAFINELERRIGTFLYGRKMYETMVFWETFDADPDTPPSITEFVALWRAADKVVYSRTLDAVSSARTRLERSLDPPAVRHLKDTASRDLSINGPNLASQAFASGLVDEVHLYVTPVTVGAGTAALPGGLASQLELRGVDRFTSGVVHLHYGLTT